MVPTQEPATVAEAKGNAEDSLRTPATRSPSAVGAEETNVVLAEELTTAKKYRPGFKTTVAVKLAFCGAVVPDWAVLPVEAIIRAEDEVGGGEEELPVEPDKGAPLQPGLPET